MMRIQRILLSIVFGICALSRLDVEGANPKSTVESYPFALCESNGKGAYLLIETDTLKEDPRNYSYPKLPDSEIPEKITKRDLGKENNPYFHQVYMKFPMLADRQLKVKSTRSMKEALAKDKRPLDQMFPHWVGSYYSHTTTHAISGQKKKVVDLGRLQRDFPIASLIVAGDFDETYRKPEYMEEMVKPFLFNVNGKYFSVYGTAQVARHIPVKSVGRSAALRVPGNMLYAQAKKLPVVLQSCGVDKDGVIWLADKECNLAFYRTRTNNYVQESVHVDGASPLLVPRKNLSSSVFGLCDRTRVYKEFKVSLKGKATLSVGKRSIPGDATQILHCDEKEIIYTHRRGISRRVDDKTTKWKVELKPDETIVEGLYASGAVILLVGKRAPKRKDGQNSGDIVREIQDGWKTMRVVTKTVADK